MVNSSTTCVAKMTERQSEVLRALRRIIRATDLHSKRQGRKTGLTTPQLLVLQAIHQQPDASVNWVATKVNLSQATVSNILDRLQARDLVQRIRSNLDKRRLCLQLTAKGEECIQHAPQPFQQAFSQRFDALPEWEQYQILASLNKVASMMDAEDLDASPYLDIGPIN